MTTRKEKKKGVVSWKSIGGINRMSIPRTNYAMSILTCFPLHHSKHANKTKSAKEALIGITDIKRSVEKKKKKRKKKKKKTEIEKAPEKSTVGKCGSPARSRNEYHLRIDEKREKLMTMSKGNFSKEYMSE